MSNKLEISLRMQASVNNIKLNLPKGFHAPSTINRVEKQKMELIQIYREYVERIKHNDTSVSKNDFDDVYNRILQCDQTIMNICEQIEDVNMPTVEKKRELENAMESNRQKIHNMYNLQDQFYVNKTDIQEVVRMIKENHVFKDDLASIYTTDYVITEDGDAAHFLEERDVPKPKQTKGVAKQGTRGRKSKQNTDNQIKDIDIDAIKARVKDILKAKFKFQDKKQCLSRTKANFMSKDEIIGIIDNDDDLKKIMPPNYKKMNKEGLCEYLFDKI